MQWIFLPVLFQQPNALAAVWFQHIFCLVEIFWQILQIHPVPKSLPLGFCVRALNPVTWCWSEEETLEAVQLQCPPSSLRHQASLTNGKSGWRLVAIMDAQVYLVEIKSFQNKQISYDAEMELTRSTTQRDGNKTFSTIVNLKITF